MNEELDFTGTKLKEIQLKKSNCAKDSRGTFKRVWDKQEDVIGINQTSISTNRMKGTLRGIHSLNISLKETKIVECIGGSLFDIVVDLRVGSTTYLKWMGLYLNEDIDYAVVIPPGFGHGFLTLEADTTVLYQMSCQYDPKFEIGIRFDDPKVDIEWPSKPSIVSTKDLSWDLLE